MRGSLYKNGNRWWWRVKLPGEKKRKGIPLKPAGAKLPTKDKDIAIGVAEMLWQQAVTGKTDSAKTISDVVNLYHEHCKTYY
jgi:hypothetical protein